VLLVVIASALLGCVLIAFALLIRSHMRPSTPAVAAGQTSAAVPTPAPKQSAVPTPSAAPTPEQVLDVPPVAVEAEEPEAIKPQKPVTQPRPTATTTSVAPKPSKKCDQPFYVDSSGIKHIKPECM
jgi:outer membrane biosynthesis protein TonB